MPAANRRQQIDQPAKQFSVDMAKLGSMDAADLLVEPLQEGQTLAGDPCRHVSSVLAPADSTHEAHLFHAVEQSRHVRNATHEPLSHLVPAQTVGASAPQNPEDVVLRRCDVERLQRLSQSVLEHGVRSRDVEEGLLFQTVEGLALFQLLLKGSAGHRRIIRVITRIVKSPVERR